MNIVFVNLIHSHRKYHGRYAVPEPLRIELVRDREVGPNALPTMSKMELVHDR